MSVLIMLKVQRGKREKILYPLIHKGWHSMYIFQCPCMHINVFFKLRLGHKIHIVLV